MGCGHSSKTKPVVDDSEVVQPINILPGSPPKRARQNEQKGEVTKDPGNVGINHRGPDKKKSPAKVSPAPIGRTLKPTMSLSRAPSGYKGLARSKLVRSMIVKHFKDADEDNDGRINHLELLNLYTNIVDANHGDMTAKEAMLLMQEMDRKQDSSVLMEFEVVGSCMRELGNLDTKGIEKENMTKLQ